MYFTEVLIAAAAYTLSANAYETAVWKDQGRTQVVICLAIAAAAIVINLWLSPSSLICGLVALAALITFRLIDFVYPTNKPGLRRLGNRETLGIALFSTALSFVILLVAKVIQSLQ